VWSDHKKKILALSFVQGQAAAKCGGIVATLYFVANARFGSAGPVFFGKLS
jgi:hypothetical protein